MARRMISEDEVLTVKDVTDLFGEHVLGDDIELSPAILKELVKYDVLRWNGIEFIATARFDGNERMYRGVAQVTSFAVIGREIDVSVEDETIYTLATQFKKS